MKYMKEFRKATNREDFIRLVLQNHIMSESSARRRYYECKKYLISKNYNNKIKYNTLSIENCELARYNQSELTVGNMTKLEFIKIITEILSKFKHTKSNQMIYENEHKLEPNYRKKIIFEDLKLYLKNKNKKEYMKKGFSTFELNWLEDEGML